MRTSFTMPTPAGGARVVHIETGTGYYTAILAHLAGASGRVTGIEYDTRDSLRRQGQFRIPSKRRKSIEGDGAPVPFEEADVIYVNAGCTRPAEKLARSASPMAGA